MLALFALVSLLHLHQIVDCGILAENCNRRRKFIFGLFCVNKSFCFAVFWNYLTDHICGDVCLHFGEEDLIKKCNPSLRINKGRVPSNGFNIVSNQQLALSCLLNAAKSLWHHHASRHFVLCFEIRGMR